MVLIITLFNTNRYYFNREPVVDTNFESPAMLNTKDNENVSGFLPLDSPTTYK